MKIETKHFTLQTIMVGSDFQATIPEGLQTYDDAMPYENEDKLLWDPMDVSEKEVKDYLSVVQDLQVVDTNGVDSIPKGSHVRDDEQVIIPELELVRNCSCQIPNCTLVLRDFLKLLCTGSFSSSAMWKQH